MEMAIELSEAVLAMIQIATCSLISTDYFRKTCHRTKSPRTKFAGVHETPNSIIGSFDFGTFARTRYEGLHDLAQNIRDDLDEQLTNINLMSSDCQHEIKYIWDIITDRLWAKILMGANETMSNIGTGVETYKKLSKDCCKARQSETQEPHPESPNRQSRVVAERDQSQSDIIFVLCAVLLSVTLVSSSTHQ